MEFSEPRFWLLAGALVIGLLFGFVGRLSGFCLRSAIVENAEGRAGRQSVAWIVAIATAVAATQLLVFVGLIDISESIYLSSSVAWGALFLGGLVFGVGMMLTRGCGARHLALAAGGNLRSWVVLVSFGLAAYATLRGILAPLRSWIEGLAVLELDAGSQGLAEVLASIVDPWPGIWSLGIVALIVVLAAYLVLKIKKPRPVAFGLSTGVAMGLLVPAGWYVTGVLGFDEFDPGRVESLSFTAPVGNAIQYLMTFTGAQADFGIVVVGGVLLGAFFTALLMGSLRAEGFETPGHLARYALGGAMMGFGGVLALGCTIGAGLSGISTLSLGSMIAMAGIVTGGFAAQRLQTTSPKIPTTVLAAAE